LCVAETWWLLSLDPCFRLRASRFELFRIRLHADGRANNGHKLVEILVLVNQIRMALSLFGNQLLRLINRGPERSFDIVDTKESAFSKGSVS